MKATGLLSYMTMVIDKAQNLMIIVTITKDKKIDLHF